MPSNIVEDFSPQAERVGSYGEAGAAGQTGRFCTDRLSRPINECCGTGSQNTRQQRIPPWHRGVPELSSEPSNFEHRAVIPRRTLSIDRYRVTAGSCSAQPGIGLIAVSPPSIRYPGAISCSTARPPTPTNLSNRRCPIQEQRLTRSAPRSRHCRSLHISLMPKSQGRRNLRISLMPRSQGRRSLRMSLTRTCSLWQTQSWRARETLGTTWKNTS